MQFASLSFQQTIQLLGYFIMCYTLKMEFCYNLEMQFKKPEDCDSVSYKSFRYRKRKSFYNSYTCLTHSMEPTRAISHSLPFPSLLTMTFPTITSCVFSLQTQEKPSVPFGCYSPHCNLERCCLHTPSNHCAGTVIAIVQNVFYLSILFMGIARFIEWNQLSMQCDFAAIM